MKLGEILYPEPRIIARDSIASSWLGMLFAWGALGFGGVAFSRAIGLLVAPELSCTASASVCAVSGWSGLMLGATSLCGAPLLWVFVARGLGPPVGWWLPSVVFASIASVPFVTVDGVLLSIGWLLTSAVCSTLAVLFGVGAMMRGKSALLGWLRVDGLDIREVPRGTSDRLVPLTAFGAALAGAAFGAFVIRTLASG